MTSPFLRIHSTRFDALYLFGFRHVGWNTARAGITPAIHDIAFLSYALYTLRRIHVYSCMHRRRLFTLSFVFASATFLFFSLRPLFFLFALATFPIYEFDMAYQGSQGVGANDEFAEAMDPPVWMDYGLPVELPILCRQLIVKFLAPATKLWRCEVAKPRFAADSKPTADQVPIPMNVFTAPSHCDYPRRPPAFLGCVTCRISPMHFWPLSWGPPDPSPPSLSPSPNRSHPRLPPARSDHTRGVDCKEPKGPR